MATGNVVGAVVWVGSVHVVDGEQAAVGYPAVMLEVRLPLVENVPVSASFGVPVPVEVNVVAETVMCQPAAVPVASTTVYVSSAAVGSTRCWSTPVAAAVHPRLADVVRFSVPAPRVSVPVSEQDAPAAHVTA
jgi:hypothetical protein